MNREHEALKIRYRALSDDWNRMRNVEREWAMLRDKVIYLCCAVAILMSMAVFTGAI